MTKRLFIFAGYDADGIVDGALLYYLKALSELGDIVFVMDNKLAHNDEFKLQHLSGMLHVSAVRHGEYDFGSYKRGYIWARDNNKLQDYDWVYLVNDSVYGPLFPLEPVLTQLESENNNGAFGMIGLHTENIQEHGWPEHVQSWFVALSQQVATSPYFDKFITSIEHQEDKMDIVWKYEVGLSQLLIANGIKIGRLEKTVSGLRIYDGWHRSLPFVKKLALQNVRDIKGFKNQLPKCFVDCFSHSAARLNLWSVGINQIWKIKIFNRITLLSMETNSDNSIYILRILKIIPIKFIKYKSKKKK